MTAEARRRGGAEETEHLNQISGMVVDAAIEVHRTLGGPGRLESVYEEALVHELGLRGLHVERQCALPIVYKGVELGSPLRLDLLAEGSVVVECKATTQSLRIFEAQVLTYLRISKRRLGLLLNFGAPRLIDGLLRIVNDL